MAVRGLFAIVLVGLLSVTVHADEWAQWRGPQRTGISAEKGLLAEWPNGGPKLVWQISDLGGGYGAPAVTKSGIYLLSNEGLDTESVQALDVKTGKQRWTTPIGKVGNPDQKPPYPGARSTPTVEDEVLYALGSDGDLVCLENASGKVRWKKNLRTDFGGEPGQWAYAESPLVDGNALIVTPGGERATIVALNKRDGSVIWKTPIAGEKAAYSSVTSTTFEGKKQYVQFLANALVGVDAKTGKQLWSYDQTAKGSMANIPTPISDKGFVYSGAGMSGGGLVKLKQNGNAIEAEQIYFDKKLPTAIGGVVKLGDYLYGTNTQGLLCIEFGTGTPKWQNRSIGAASVLAAENRLYLHCESGDVALVEATPEEYREKGRFTPPGGPDRGKSKAWAYPVIAGGRLYIRDLGSMWCYDIKDVQASK